ncbi:MAG: LacI family DNA-binding transcriptional regulator [Acidimicrobiales bacterium]
MGATIYDVARHAGVSPSTVANVLRGYKYVSASMRARVEASIAALDYRPNAAARNLRLGRSGSIAVAVPELIVPYFSELCEAIVDEASRHSYTVIIECTKGDPEEERRLLADPSLGHTVDGLIFSPLGLGGDQLQLGSRDTPVIMLGERVHDDGVFDHVLIDNTRAAREAVEHLIDLGRTRIAVIGRQPTESTGAVRILGYQEALGAAGHPIDETLEVPTSHYYRDEGSAAMAQLLELAEPPDAVFCANDLLAVGALRTIQKAGLRVPDDIAVVGFDGTDEGKYTIPSLTTIAPDKADIAARAVGQLCRRVEGDASPPAVLEASYELVVRESSGTAAGRPGHGSASATRRTPTAVRRRR